MSNEQYTTIHQQTPASSNELLVAANVRIPASIFDTGSQQWNTRYVNLSQVGSSGVTLADAVTHDGLMAVTSEAIYDHVANAVAQFTPAWVRSRVPGTILLVRNNAVVLDGGDNRVTAADYGNGFKAVLAAAQPGDVIICGPGVFELTNSELTANGVTIYCNGTRLKTNANYDWIFRVSGERNTIYGLTVDGAEQANVPPLGNNAWGFNIRGHDTTLINCGDNGVTAALFGFGGGLFVWEAFRFKSYNYRSEKAYYAGFILTDAADAALYNTVCINPRNRVGAVRTGKAVGEAVGSGTMPAWRQLTIDGLLGYVSEQLPGWSSVPAINFDLFRDNIGQRLGTLNMRRVWMKSEDIYSDTVTNNVFKFQGIDRVCLDDVCIDHHANAGSGEIRSITVESVNQPIISELIMHNVRCSGHVNGNSVQFDRAVIDNSHFGLHQCEGGITMRNFLPKTLHVTRSTFNCHAGSRCFDTPSPIPDGFDWSFDGNELRGDKASILYGFLGTALANAGGRFRFSRSNKLINAGGGGFSLSHIRAANMICSTDRNGDMLWDEDIAAASGSYYAHPEPGAGPNYFPELGPGVVGTKIWNIRKASTGAAFPTCWISDGTNWKSLIA